MAIYFFFLNFRPSEGVFERHCFLFFFVFHPDLKGEILYDGTRTSARKTSHLFFIYFSSLGKGNAEPVRIMRLVC